MQTPLAHRSLVALLPGCLLLAAAAIAWFQPPRSVPATLEEIEASFPSETLVWDAEGELLGSLPDRRRGVWIDGRDLPQTWRDAVTDRRGAPRPGRLLLHALGGRPPGTGSPWSRLVDQREAAALERALGRDGTLEALANTFAVREAGGAGVDLAARHYFSVRGTDLDRDQAEALARLATGAPGAPQSPRRAPDAPSPILTLVADELRAGPVGAALEARGITDPAGAGLQVVTTLDPAIQRATDEVLALRRPGSSPADGLSAPQAVVLREGAVLAFAGPPVAPAALPAGERSLAAPPPEIGRLSLVGLALERGWTADMLLDADAATVPFEPASWVARGQVPDTITVADALRTGNEAAAASLLLHLYDHTDPEELLALADELGLLPSPGETPRAYHRRLRERSVRPSVDAERQTLATLELQRAAVSGPTLPASAALVERLEGWRTSWARIRQSARRRSLGDVDLVGWWCRDEPREASFGESGPGWRPMTASWLAETLTGPLERRRPLRAVFGPHAALLDGRVPVSTVAEVFPAPARLPAGPRRWDPANLVFDPTFRVALALEELASLMEAAGAGTQLSRSPDLVRGGDDVSLLPSAAVAEAVLSGSGWGDRPRLVREVRTREGELIWSARPAPRPLLGRAPSALARVLRTGPDLALPDAPPAPAMQLRVVGAEDRLVVAVAGGDPAALLRELAQRVRPAGQPGPTSLATPATSSSPSRGRALPK